MSETLIVEQSDEIFGVAPINWEDSSWKQLSLFNDAEVISLSHAMVYVFSDSVLCLGKVNRNPTSKTAWEQQLGWFKDSPQYRTLDTIDGRTDGISSGTCSQDSPHCMTIMGDPSEFKGRIIFMSMFNDIIWGSEDNERECSANATLVSILAKRFPAGRWSFLGPGSEKKLMLTDQDENGIDFAELMMILVQRKRTPSFPSHESIVPRNAQKQRRWKNIKYTSVPMEIPFPHAWCRFYCLPNQPKRQNP